MLVTILEMVCSMLLSNNSTIYNSIYRVSVRNDDGYVNVICLGTKCIDSNEVGCYASVSDLPEWMQDRIAVLSMVKSDDRIRNVGWKTEEGIFWLTNVQPKMG